MYATAANVLLSLSSESAKLWENFEKHWKNGWFQFSPGGEEKYIDCQLVFANTLMSLAMRMREKAKDIRMAQQQDLRQRK